ncbi:MAG: amidohydrolase [Pseudolabrys sp.]|nr:amidohydrolase [Pseudolabrys sp.]
MRVFDCHSHWSTKRGYVFQTEEELRNQKTIWGTAPEFQTEQEFMDTLRRNKVRAMLDLATTVLYPMTMDQIRAEHDYTFEIQRANSDVIFGHWLSLNPRLGKDALREYERAVAAKAGFIGFGIIGQIKDGLPPSDPIWDPFYKLSIDAGIPVLIHTGLTGIGQGLPGGRGIILDHGHPRHIDAVAARFPELKILAGRPAYPWQDEMIAIMLHKGNVHYELHGWSPKTLSPALKREIGGRLQDRIMFGCDYPVLKYEMMIERWRGLGYSEEVLEKILHKNAEAYFPGANKKSQAN